MATPIGMVKAPSPIDAHIMKLAVFEFVTLNLYSPGNVMNKANIDARNIPTKSTPPYAAKYSLPNIAAPSINSDVPIMPTSKTLSLSEILPLMYNKMILNVVFDIQNNDPRILAPSGVAIFLTTAYVGIQLPNPTSSPMYNKYSTHVNISAFLLIGSHISLFLTESLAYGAFKK